MKHPKALTSAASIFATVSLAQAATININVTSGNGSNANQPLDGTAAIGVVATTGTVWNDVDSTITNPNLNYGDGSGASGIGIARTSTGGNANPGFSFSQTDGLAVGAADILDNYLAATNNFGPPLAAPLTFSITGLNPIATYDIHFVSVGDSVGQGGTFTIGGTTLTTSGASPDGPLADGDNFVSFTGLSGATGNIDFDFSAGPGNVSFAALSGLQIVETVPEPSSSLLVALAGLGLIVRRRR